MLKQEVIRSLKKNNICKNAEKTQARVREVWAPLKKNVREEILSLADIKKVSVERAYKTGGASAKVIVAIAQVVNIDPRWLTGEVDEKGTYSGEIVLAFLKKLGYDVGKNDVGRAKRKVTPKIAPPVKKAAPKAKAAPKKAAANTKKANAPAESPPDMYNVTRELAKLLSKDMRTKLEKITDDDVTLLIKSLTVQATFNDEKQSRLALIKCLLLV